MEIDGCSITVRRAEGTNMGFVFGDGVASHRTVSLAEDVIVTLMFRDPPQAPLLHLTRYELVEQHPILIREKTLNYNIFSLVGAYRPPS